MSQGTSYIVSLKFAPGLKKEFMVLGENSRKKGINVKYILSKSYDKLEGKCDGTEYIATADGVKGMLFDTIKFINGKQIIDIFYKHPPVSLLFYNPHPLNPFIARLAKRKFPEVTNILYLHDPYKQDKKPYGKIKAIYFTFAEIVQDLTIRYMNYVVSPSQYSSQLFNLRYSNFKGTNYIAPLLIPDQKNLEMTKRNYFTLVGTVHPSTGLDTLLQLINYVAMKGLNFEFALISSSNISKYLQNLSEQAQKILKVINKKILDDSEINEIVEKSYAIFRLDKEVTQSGVIPVAYMNSTPVIVRDIPGLRQHVKHKEDGCIIPYNCGAEDLLEAMIFTKMNFHQMSRNARKSFEETWAEWNWDKYYSWLVDKNLC